MKKNPASQSGIFTTRAVIALTLCSFGLLLGMFSLAATPLSELTSGAEPTARSESSPSQKPAETTRTSAGAPSVPANLLGGSTANTNQLPAGVPLPPGARFSPHGQTHSATSPTAEVPGFAGRQFQPASVPSVNSLGNLAQQNISTSPLTSTPGSPGWSIVNSPNGLTDVSNDLYSVTCTSTSDCWAVGTSFAAAGNRTLIEHWDGTAWRIVTSPNATPTLDNILYSVTCTSSSNCWAVGFYVGTTAKPLPQTLIEQWNGTSWDKVDSPNPTSAGAVQRNFLFGVACESANKCWAVGTSEDTASPISTTLVEQWDPTKDPTKGWQVATSENAGPANALEAVTCSATDCWAVGSTTAGSSLPLIERWNSTLSAWTIVASPNVGGRFSQFLGVACASPTECWAVGYSSPDAVVYQTLTARWDGTLWTVVSSPNASSQNGLFNVTCQLVSNVSNCWAVGAYDTIPTAQNGAAGQPLILHWDGTTQTQQWSIVSFPNPAPFSSLYGVTCASETECWAVGAGGTDIDRTLVGQWDGKSWSIVTSPNVRNDVGSILYGVTCVSASDCWAVGQNLENSGSIPLIEHWDGNSWSIVSSPNASPGILVAVACAATSDCFAVGYHPSAPPGGIDTLIEHWNGTSWTIFNSPNTSANRNHLYGVACSSASDCWAVGRYFTAGSTDSADQTLIEHWDGTSWTIVSSPNVPDAHPNTAFNNNDLFGLACASASDCWAVGANSQFYAIGTGITDAFQNALIEHWDGMSWTIVKSPGAVTGGGTLVQSLSSVTCTSTSDCWAVGSQPGSTLTSATLVERWDGTTTKSWSIISSPNPPGSKSAGLKAVACASPSNCWAIGSYLNAGYDQTLTERWDSSSNSWTIVSSPNNTFAGATTNNSLTGVACISASDCWAVGRYSLGGGSGRSQTLTEHYGFPFVQLNNAVSRKSHGSAGTFDITLPLVGRSGGIECRSGGANGDYTLVFNFVNTLTSVSGASVTSGTGAVVSSTIDSDAHNYIVNLTGVTNAQVLKISLTNVTDSGGNFSSTVSTSMGVLIGDVNANGVVSNADVSLVKAQVAAGGSVDSSNFRDDVNANGVISNADVSLTKAQVAAGAQLPP